MNYEIIASGSHGNATLIGGKILIDCGVPMKLLKKHARYIQLVLLTHNHCDHFLRRTVTTLARIRPVLRWACCEWMLQPLLDAGVFPCQIDVLKPGEAASYEGLAAVMPEKLAHNVPNCCWHLFMDGESLIYATDTGTLDGIEAKDYDLYLIEANHSRAEIEERAAEKQAAGEYAYEISAAENHLSMEQAIDWLTGNMSQRSIWIPMHQHRKISAKEIMNK